MNFPKIAFKIEDRVYRMDASDGPAIKKIPKQDREHLLTLLAAIKKQHELDNPNSVGTTIPSEPKLEMPVQVPVQVLSQVTGQVKPSQENDLAKKSNKTDIDQLMLRLAAEEKRKQKPFDKNKAYLYLGGATVLILCLLYLMI